MAMESLLSQAAAELALRTEVESTLTSILQDVETAHNLSQSLEHYNELHQCRQKLKALQVRYEDREAAWEADRREKERLGLVLLEEIVKLSAREVEEEKRRHELERKVQQLEEEHRIASERLAAQVGLPTQQLANFDDTTRGEMMNQTAITNEGMNAPLSPTKPEEGATGDVITSTSIHVLETDAPPLLTNLPTTPSSKIIATKETSELEAISESSFAPHNLNEATLMNIFANLDPLDVMSFAQANKALLSKVNIMFGMGSSGDEEAVADSSERQQHEQISSNEEQGDLPMKTMEQLSLSEPTPTIASLPPKPPTIAQTVETSLPPPSSSPTRSSPKLFGLQGPSSALHRRQGSGTSVSTAGSGSGNPFTQVFSRFGGSAMGVASDVASPSLLAGSAPSSTPAAASLRPPQSSSESTSEIKFNAAMANSMASKLTPAELSIILRMRERLQQCEADANRWRLEKEDAVANLDSVKAVKEFLVTRVRDTEKLVEVQKEEMKQIQKKNLEDQEVIVYLDERVKDLERRMENMKVNEEATKKESMQLVQKHEKKVMVLSDMLQFEREQTAANESEWKIAKKLLVKEVKSCRARLVGLEAELEGCRQQNGQLKHGLMALQSTGSTSPKGKKLVNY
ncbi:hypothetical protein ACHAWU_001601 [Discostella pseudostelligera]|uniref:Uncharacterized protein n=1 Tax=Discostella pseudostelligera TaxID=259834 RepID=A0ABD3MIN1_9STRA